MIELSGVSVEYILTNERPRTLRDYFVNLASGKKAKTTKFLALDDISLSIKRGESFGIIGSNGAGKSTLLKVIAGIIDPTEGEVVIRGKVVPLIELGTGFDMELTGRENIYLNASILGLSKKETDKKFNRIVEFAELKNFIYAPLRNYSSGMVARLAFSIAVEVETEALIVDEVLSVGDEGFRKKCQEKIDGIISGGVTVLFVSHAMGDVQRLCNRILWLEHGKIEASGDADRITRKYLLHFDKTVFEDIHEGHPYKKYIDAMFISGVTSGYAVNGKRYYNPDNKITRAEFAVFLSKALGIKKSLPSAKIVLADVPEPHWAFRYIAWLFEQGIVNGVKNEEGKVYFYPDDYLTMDNLMSIMAGINAEKCKRIIPEQFQVITRAVLAKIFCVFFDFLTEP